MSRKFVKDSLSKIYPPFITLFIIISTLLLGPTQDSAQDSAQDSPGQPSVNWVLTVSSLRAHPILPIIRGNIITDNSVWGVRSNLSSSALIINNKITGNTVGDIAVSAGSSGNISFNVYDTISNGGTAAGQFNVNSNGDPAPAP